MDESVEDAASVTTNPPLELPRGRFSGKLDDKGRLKLPATFQQFLGALPEKKLFITSLDRNIAQIYPIAEWRKNEAFFDNYTEDPDAARAIAFIASDCGAETEPDGQGRITIHTELRRELAMEGTDLHLVAYKGHIDVYTNAIYQKIRSQASAEEISRSLNRLQKAGLR